MLQNRVSPYGELIRTKARGAWLGNRGVIHDELKEIVRPYKIKAWITCMIKFRGRQREIMQPDRWTELFFLDEATAFSAGHRPCFQCRYRDHRRFKRSWLKGNAEWGFDLNTPVSAIDDIIHAERIAPDRSKVTYSANINHLPDGTFISYDKKPYLINGKQMYLWCPEGYSGGVPFPTEEEITVLTPRSIVKMFGAGYIPQMGI
ncbi:MAG: hypothetical protein INR73_07275 [Williamsia sp.]|nr:hypothetical protein [Williamsia sp.]